MVKFWLNACYLAVKKEKKEQKENIKDENERNEKQPLWS